MQSIDTGDDGYLDEVEPDIDEFQRMWLEYFIGRQDALSLVTWLTFAHGRRLAILALAERRNRSRTHISAEEERLSELRRRIHRLDLEMDEILSARNPSLIQREGAGKVGTGDAVTGAGAALASEREHLFREFVGLRDVLLARGAYPSPVKLSAKPARPAATTEEPGQYDRNLVRPQGIRCRFRPLPGTGCPRRGRTTSGSGSGASERVGTVYQPGLGSERSLRVTWSEHPPGFVGSHPVRQRR